MFLSLTRRSSSPPSYCVIGLNGATPAKTLSIPARMSGPHPIKNLTMLFSYARRMPLP